MLQKANYETIIDGYEIFCMEWSSTTTCLGFALPDVENSLLLLYLGS